MFHVLKGYADIKMVYDGTKSGLYYALFAPWFMLPTSDVMCRWAIAVSWLADKNYGDQFLNFPLHLDLQKYCGIDLSQLFPKLSKNKAQIYVGVWLQNVMGLKPSLYVFVQGATRVKRIMMGNYNMSPTHFNGRRFWKTYRFHNHIWKPSHRLVKFGRTVLSFQSRPICE